MPAYEEALAADPTAFVDCASEMGAAGNDLTDHRAEYDSAVTRINDGWQDTANTAFNDDVNIVDEHVDEVASKVGEASELLSTGGSAMVSQVEQLKAADAAYKGAGFVVQPAPKVELGPVHWAAIAAAGPFGPVLQAMFQARADEGTALLSTGLAVLTATDVATGTALTAAGEALEPLEDKGPGPTICPPVPPDEPADAKAEKEERRADVKADKDSGKDEKDEKDKDGKDDDKDKEKDDGEKDKEDQDENKDKDEDKREEQPDQDPERPGNEQPEATQPDPTQPGEIPGYDPGSPVQPEVPDFNADPYVPTSPDLGDPWKPADIEDPETPSGGLASGGGGGGLGGGIGSPDLPGGTTGGPAGGTGLVTAPASAAATGAPGTGGRSGLGGGLLGAPGARGAANPDEEFERESFLTEDPEDDVWGIGTDEGNPYVDYAEEQPKQPELPPLPTLDDPPFTLPGFELPDTGKP